MPIVRYIVWVGTSLLALLFVANWFLPESLREPTPEASNRPVIRIASIQQPPERIDIDTSQPTIVPPPMLFGEAVPDQPSPLLESYASVTPPETAVNLAVASAKPGTTVQPTRLSFADIISGRLVRNLFNLD